MNVRNGEREMMLKRIQICDFALNDAALFLNLNPTDRAALEFYRKHNAIRKEAAEKYISKYGPLSHADYDGGDRWKWADTPWPWQNEEE